MKGESRAPNPRKAELVRNERDYGPEIRAKFGDAAVDAANARYAGMDADAFARMQSMSSEIIRLLLAAMDEGDPGSATAGKLVRLHRDWLLCFWTEYSPEAHRTLGDAYVEDPRFRAFYDRFRPGAASFLRDAIRTHA